MKHSYKLIAFGLVTAFLTACSLNINTDPNRVTESTITGDLIFPAAAFEVAGNEASAAYTFLNNWLGYWSISGQFAVPTAEATYNITPSFNGSVAIWNAEFGTLFDLYKAETKSIAEGDTAVAACSIILAASRWQNVVDMFGDIPYSQAFQYTTFPNPKYDKAQDVYNDLQTRLDLAIEYLAHEPSSPPVLAEFQQADIVHGGVLAPWIKFANTLKLRLLIHQSEIPGFDPSAEIAKIMAKGGVLHSGESVVINPGFIKALNKQSPFYNNFGLTVNNNLAAAGVVANNYFIGLLINSDDPRVTQYYTSPPAGTNYGQLSGNPQNASGVGPGLANNPKQDAWLFTSVESMFLEAEAIQRGWMPGDAQASYEAAVTESFIFLKVPDAVNAAADYLSENPYAPGIANLIQAKYLSLGGYAPVEVWSDLRRIGYENVLPDGYITRHPAAISKTIPVRLLYPQNEYTTNSAAVLAEGDINQFTSRIFWDIN